MAYNEKFSLQHEIKKRKTQEILRVIESKRVAATKPQTSPNERSYQGMPVNRTQPTMSSTSSDVRRMTQTVKAISSSKETTKRVNKPSNISARQAQRSSYDGIIGKGFARLNSRQRRQLTAALTVLVSLALWGILAWGQSPRANMPNYPELPSAGGEQIINYLQRHGLRVANIARLSSQLWHAKEQFAFDVILDNMSSRVTLLSYDSNQAQALDYGVLALDLKYKTSSFLETANILLIMPPNTASSIRAALTSHLTSLLETSYRPYLPTPTN